MARVSLTSPLGRTMPTSSSYRVSSGVRRNSIGSPAPYTSNYSTSYNSSYKPYVPGANSTYTSTTSNRNKYEPNNRPLYSTGATSSAYSDASTKFGGAYGTSSKPPPYRSRITSPSPSRRPLPDGPGPRDVNNRRVPVDTALTTLRTSRPNRVSTPTRNGPLKADHSYKNGYSSPTSYSPHSYETTPRLSRNRRTSSISDLSRDVGSMTLGSSRKYGSIQDVNTTPRASLIETTTNDIGYGSSRRNQMKTQHMSTDSVDSSLPDINDRPNSNASRSPSIESRGRSRDNVNDSSLARGGARRDSYSSYNYTPSSSTRNSPDDCRGQVGLRNLGNTCFMNSILQCLSHTTKLRQYLISRDYEADINTSTSSMKGALVKSFAKMIQSMWEKSPNSSVSPNDFKEKISKFAPRFIGYNQQDAQEFLVYLLEGLNEDLNRVKKRQKRIIDCDTSVVTTPAAELADTAWNNFKNVDNSFITDMFVGQLRSELICQICGYTSNTFDVFMDLSLPIKKKYGSSCTLVDCFSLFTQEETLDGEERPTCAKCKKRQRCTKRFSIQRFPEILVIHLKRFSQDSSYRSKLSTTVDYPTSGLDLAQYAADTGIRGPSRYNLYAVSCHHGTPYGGHYTAMARSAESKQWYNFNDQSVSSTSGTRACTSEAYVLFYHRSNSSS